MNLDGLKDAGTAKTPTRWATDEAGRSIYYPRGQAFGGYLVTDREREQAIRDSDQRFDDIDKRLTPFAGLLFLPVISVFYYFSAHPLLAYLVFPAAVVLAGAIVWLVRRPRRAPLLAGLARVPPANGSGIRPLHRTGFVLLALVGAILLVLYLYDQRIAAASAGSRTIDFYPDISQYLLFAGFAALMLSVFIAGWHRLSARVGPNRAILSAFVLALLGVIPAAEAVSNFYDPKPAVVLSQDTFYCERTVLWAEVAGLSLRSGSRGRQYARVEVGAGGRPVRDCEIDGLNADYADVYQAIYAQWQATKASAAVHEPATNSLLTRLKQIPRGAGREKVVAVLGEPMTTGPGGGGVVSYIYPMTQAGKPSGLAENAWRVVVVYFDEYDRVDRSAVYGVGNGTIIDDISHNPLARGGFEYPLLSYFLEGMRPAAGPPRAATSSEIVMRK
jgi:hypothetical protein